MNYSLIILSDNPAARPSCTPLAAQLGYGAGPLYTAFLEDTLGLARQIVGARVSVVARPGSRRPLAGERSRALDALGVTLSAALAGGPTLLIGGDMPHLPLWRLRDALTHLRFGADLVIGPGESGGWYLIGMRGLNPALLRSIPPRDGSADELAVVARAERLRTAWLPAWYTLDNQSDLDRLIGDLRPMPAHVAAHTRALLAGAAPAERAVGG